MLSLLSPFPIKSIFGQFFCNLVAFLGGTTVFGSTFWGCCIAVFRVLCIKAHTWLSIKIGVLNLLYWIIIAGVIQILPLNIILFFYDDSGPSYKLCLAESKEDYNIMSDYWVII